MKKILITGANSYIGTSLEKWLERFPDEYYVDKVSVRDEVWKKKDFSNFDVVFHVAGIAHVSSNPKMKDLYYRVNRDLAIEVARKAKFEGVKQFIFMSSIIVYGDSSTNGVIDVKTCPKPNNFYGSSKFQAEQGILALDSDDYNIVILRPPMIYGKGAKGNYSMLGKIARKVPIFPDVENKRSMLHIDNLCELIKLIIENEERGLFFPQNKEYVKTSEMVRLIAEVNGNKVVLTKVFNLFIRLMFCFKVVNKVFGNLVYDKSMSNYEANYQISDLRKSIELTEG